MLLVWIGVALVAQHFQSVDEAWAGLMRLDDVVDVAERGANVGIGELFLIRLLQLHSKGIGILGRAQLQKSYQEEFANPYVGASLGYIDDIIEPHQTRPRLINALEMLRNKRDGNPQKKHGNMPL